MLCRSPSAVPCLMPHRDLGLLHAPSPYLSISSPTRPQMDGVPLPSSATISGKDTELPPQPLCLRQCGPIPALPPLVLGSSHALASSVRAPLGMLARPPPDPHSITSSPLGCPCVALFCLLAPAFLVPAPRELIIGQQTPSHAVYPTDWLPLESRPRPSTLPSLTCDTAASLMCAGLPKSA